MMPHAQSSPLAGSSGIMEEKDLSEKNTKIIQTWSKHPAGDKSLESSWYWLLSGIFLSSHNFKGRDIIFGAVELSGKMCI